MIRSPVFWLGSRGPGYYYRAQSRENWPPCYEWLRLTVPIIRELAEHETMRDMSVGTYWQSRDIWLRLFLHLPDHRNHAEHLPKIRQ